MKQRTAGGACALVLSMVLLGCSPSLNWRDARIGSLTALLPCKPDRAQRDVQLGERFLPMEIQGCEAQNTLFAVSHIALQNSDQASEVIAQWRSATLANMRSTALQTRPFQVKGLATHNAAVQSVAQGLNPRGAPVQAKLAWFVSGSSIFHLAVYGSNVHDELTGPLFSELKVSP